VQLSVAGTLAQRLLAEAYVNDDVVSNSRCSRTPDTSNTSSNETIYTRFFKFDFS